MEDLDRYIHGDPLLPQFLDKYIYNIYNNNESTFLFFPGWEKVAEWLSLSLTATMSIQRSVWDVGTCSSIYS